MPVSIAWVTFVLGQQVNNFEITRLIAEGAMGTVYEARHQMLGRRVAVKVLRRELASQHDLVTRFFNEARATNAVCHPNIIEIIDVGRFLDGTPYLIMELLEGESLTQRLRRLGRLELPEAVDLLQQAASALEAAHGKGVVHRDLKPDHLFLTRDESRPGRQRVKILDFGIAKLRGDQVATSLRTAAGSIFGTPLYMSPEQCLGLPDLVDERADIYALGVILYEAVSGRPPFVSQGWGDLMMMHMTHAPVAPSVHQPGLPGAIEAVILQALEKKPELRQASMAEFSRALGVAAATLPCALGTVATLESFVERNTRPGPSPAQTAFSFSQPGAATQLPATERAEGGIDPDRSFLRQRAPATPDPSSPFTRAGSRSPRRRALLGVAVTVLLTGALAVVASRNRPAATEPGAVASSASSPLASAPERATYGVAPLPAPPPARAPSAARPVVAPVTSVTPVAPVTAINPVTETKGRVHPKVAAAPDTAASRRQPARTPSEAEPASLAPSEPSAAPADVAEPPLPAQPGTLNFDSDPWAKVFLDSKELGTTPLRQVSLPPGRHVLTLRNPELGISTTYVVNVPPGGTVSRFVGWRKQ